MPHIPRRGPSIFGPAHEVIAATERQTASRPEPEPSRHQATRRTTLALPTIDMEAWDVPADKTYKAIFGMEPKRNALGELVYPRRADESAGCG